MRRLELEAYSTEEAKIQALREGITVVQDLTDIWKKAGKPMINNAIKQLVVEHMEKWDMFDHLGVGVIIALKEGKDANLKYPCILTYNRPRKGRRKLMKIWKIYRKEDHVGIGEAPTKKEAFDLARNLIKVHRQDLYCRMILGADENEFELAYSPSKKAILGNYLVFAVDGTDVFIKRQMPESRVG